MNGQPRISVNTLERIARREMVSHGLAPDFPPQAQLELRAINGAAADKDDAAIRDLKDLLWCSIDNDDSRDLDQLSVSRTLPGGAVQILVAVADVDAVVKQGSALDAHAEFNTTSVYTPGGIFPMLPERLSTDLTSLNENQDRIAIVIEMTVNADGGISASSLYRAWVRNHAKLAYNGVSDWLEGKGALPAAAARVSGMDEQLRAQDRVAQAMRKVRYAHGALELETIEPQAVVQNGDVVSLHNQPQNRAQQLIEDFMIGSNGVTARYLDEHGSPTLRRVVRTPKRWDKIILIAREMGETLPATPDPIALTKFLAKRRAADALRFPDLSLAVIKLLGSGEYVFDKPGDKPIGHFGLAVRDYSHSTAPNRRFPDLITHRLLKAVFKKTPRPYTDARLTALASHCTEQEDAATKVERQVRKSAAAQFLSHRIGESFDAIVTGASAKGTWARVINPPVEGRITQNFKGLDVGDKTRVKLLSVNVDLGFIDFAGV